jgi:hypothetical protein
MSDIQISKMIDLTKVTPYSFVEVHRRFERMYCFYLKFEFQ